MWLNESCTLMSHFALVSKNVIPYSSASIFPLLASIFLSGISHLFPIRILATSEFACCSICFTQFLMLLNEFSFVPNSNIRNVRIEGITIVSQDDPHGSFVVSLSDCSESLLSCCVPNLKLYLLGIDVYCFDFKINSYIVNACIFILLPIVEIWLVVKLLSENRRRKHVLPTPESPIIISLIR